MQGTKMTNKEGMETMRQWAGGGRLLMKMNGIWKSHGKILYGIIQLNRIFAKMV